MESITLEELIYTNKTILFIKLTNIIHYNNQ